MRIEDEIVQKRFRSEHQKAAINLLLTNSWLISRTNHILKQEGLSMQQFNLLRILRGQYPRPASINLLKERMLDKTSDASRLVERLRKKGLLIRETSEQDRRRVEVKISSEGLDVLSRVDAREEELDGLLGNLSFREAKTLNQLLDKIRG